MRMAGRSCVVLSADGGATTLDNLILFCRRHHRLVHEEGWTLVLAQDRELVAIPP